MNAFDLYLLAIRSGGKLPDHLHEAMLLWSYSEQTIVKDYLEWVDHCEKRDQNKKRLEERFKSINKIDTALSIMMMIFFFIGSLSIILKN